jgi:thymidylate synthase
VYDFEEGQFVNQEEYAYQRHMQSLYDDGIPTDDRTGTGTRSIFGHQLKFDLSDNKFPLLTTKKIHFPSAAHELLWFISGNTNIKYLQDNKVRIWDEWADEEGDLGPVYGHQWRRFDAHNYYGEDETPCSPFDFWEGEESDGIDQLQNAIDLLNNDPDSRRIIVSAWNPNQLDQMALVPCHAFFQFKSYLIDGERHLQCHMYQRSADWFLGVPFNIASYALLTHMIAKITNHKASQLVMSFGDTHLYNNHDTQVLTQLSRPPYSFPTIEIHGDQKSIDDFVYSDFELVGYEHHPLIKGKVSV